jgi:hypothetical protein
VDENTVLTGASDGIIRIIGRVPVIESAEDATLDGILTPKPYLKS